MKSLIFIKNGYVLTQKLYHISQLAMQGYIFSFCGFEDWYVPSIRVGSVDVVRKNETVSGRKKSLKNHIFPKVC